MATAISLVTMTYFWFESSATLSVRTVVSCTTSFLGGRLGDGVHVRDHSFGEVTLHELREESSEERQLMEPYEVDALLSQHFYLLSLIAS